MQESTEIQMLRAHVDAMFEQRDRLWDQYRQHEAERVVAAYEANDKRLEGMNEFRASLNDMAKENMSRHEANAQISALASKIEADVKPLEEKIETLRRPNWTLISVLTTAIGGLVAVVWLVIGLQIQAAEGPLGLSVNQVREQMSAMGKRLEDVAATTQHNEQDVRDQSQRTTATKTLADASAERLRIIEASVAASGQADSQSNLDRKQLNERVRQLEAQVSAEDGAQHTAEAAIAQKLTEIETQFCASDIVRNLLHATDMRIIALLWTRVTPNEHMPTDNAYYPQICNRQPTPR